MEMERKKRSAKQVIAALNRRKEYLGCRILLAMNLKGQKFVEVLAQNTEENRKRWPNGKRYAYSRDFWVVSVIEV